LIVGLGELLWDLLPGGPQLGGAPANFVFHAQALGARAVIVSRIGRDQLGADILKQLAQVGLRNDWVQFDEQAPTGTVKVQLDALGIPHYQIDAPVAWDNLAINDAAVELVQSCDAICFGSLAQRTPAASAAILRLVAATRPHALRLFDINLRQDCYSRRLIEDSLRLANALKLNDQELTALAEMFALTGTLNRQLELISKRFGIETIALTRGPNGSLLFRAGDWSELPGRSVKIVDTIGAGDAFAAALALGILSRMDLESIHRIASEVASYVCGHAGAMPKLPAQFSTSFASGPASTPTTHSSQQR
jgi:fructokinase